MWTGGSVGVRPVMQKMRFARLIRERKKMAAQQATECQTSLAPGEVRCHPEGAHARNQNNHKGLRATEGSLSGRARLSLRLPFKFLGQAGEVLRSAPKYLL
jgi:hypothetical protein